MQKNKVLIIRFSSFGDIIQCSSVIDPLCRDMDEVEIHWVTRSEFEYLLKLNKNISKVWSLNKKSGLSGLLTICLKLRAEQYTHVFDAHNNLRSNILKLFLRMNWPGPKIITRSKDRLKRLLLFNLRVNLFPKPFKGINSFILPLNPWGIKTQVMSPIVSWSFPQSTELKITEIVYSQLTSPKFIALVPSAAWAMKRWPLDHWKKLIELLPDKHFVVLGGSEDTFCQDLVAIAPGRVKNLAGQLSLVESSLLLTKSKLIISADTGLLHVADVLNVRGLSLMGPTAFGFTTSPEIKTLELEMPCRPCTKDGRGGCSQSTYQACMVNLSPTMVASEVLRLIRD